MGDRLRAGKLLRCAVQSATQANSASYPMLYGKWVPAKVWWCSAAGK